MTQARTAATVARARYPLGHTSGITVVPHLGLSRGPVMPEVGGVAALVMPQVVGRVVGLCVVVPPCASLTSLFAFISMCFSF